MVDANDTMKFKGELDTFVMNKFKKEGDQRTVTCGIKVIEPDPEALAWLTSNPDRSLAAIKAAKRAGSQIFLSLMSDNLLVEYVHDAKKIKSDGKSALKALEYDGRKGGDSASIKWGESFLPAIAAFCTGFYGSDIAIKFTRTQKLLDGTH